MRRAPILCLLCLCLCVSCQTKVVTEYVPMEIDLTDVINPVLEQRPDNSTMEVITDVQTVEDILTNSAAYLYAWEVWESYADSLEKTLVTVGERLRPAE